MSKLVEIKARKLLEAKQRRQEKQEERLLNKWESDSVFVERELENQLAEDSFSELLQLEDELRTIIDEAQVMINGELVEYRSYMGVKGFGKEFEKLSSIVANIVYGLDQTKGSMLEESGLSELTGIKFLEALGNPDVWSNRRKELIPATSYDLVQANYYLDKVKEQLGLDDLTVKPITEEAQVKRYEIGADRALASKLQYDSAVALAEERRGSSMV